MMMITTAIEKINNEEKIYITADIIASKFFFHMLYLHYVAFFVL